MNDYIIRAVAANDQIRAFAAVTTEMVENARERHNTSPVATAALGTRNNSGLTSLVGPTFRFNSLCSSLLIVSLGFTCLYPFNVFPSSKSTV